MDYAFIELNLAKPLIYVSKSKSWLKGSSGISRRKSIGEFRQTKRGDWVISPSFEMLKEMFGKNYKLKYLGHGVRYDMVEVYKV